jgi:putative endonuclease
MRQYYTYLLASESRRFYTGVTNDLHARVFQHKHPVGDTFASRHRIDKLVYFEVTTNARAAIIREKQLKHWPRPRKIRLIEQHNAGWVDLARGWFPIDEERDRASGNP